MIAHIKGIVQCALKIFRYKKHFYEILLDKVPDVEYLGKFPTDFNKQSLK